MRPFDVEPLETVDFVFVRNAAGAGGRDVWRAEAGLVFGVVGVGVVAADVDADVDGDAHLCASFCFASYRSCVRVITS